MVLYAILWITGDRERTRLKPADLREVKDVIMFKNHIF